MSRSRSRSRSRSKSPYSRALVKTELEMPDVDSVMIKSYLHSLHETNAARSDRIDCKIYISNLPPETVLREFLETLTKAMRAQKMLIQDNDPVRSAWQGKDNTYIFIEFFNVEEANNCLLLNGMTYMNQEFKVSRPKNYTGSQPMSSTNLNSLFGSYAIRNFQRKALETLGNAPFTPKKVDFPSCVLNLKQLIKDTKELSNESEYLDLIEDIKIECEEFGSVVSIKVPKPGNPGVGNAYVRFSEVKEARAARSALSGKRFAGHFVHARFHPEVMYDNDDFRETWELPPLPPPE
mmetsp:Transcript_13713/g.25859  ORF Transcript_13713/g.25859 Transcript_13713/m.25859 type:complete len:293 (-) Transcript_13713:1163-2041(-)